MLRIKDIGRCHPGQKTRKGKDKGKDKDKGCLPEEVYRRAKAKAKTKKVKSPWKAVGCEEGADHCLLDQMKAGNDLRKRLRPRRPKAWKKDPDQWLDNFNIQHVMGQYQEAYPWFHFLGVFPIDFSAPDPYKKGGKPQCLHRELCELDIQAEYRRGVRGVGMVFNLDPHYKGGSHWVALYIDLKNIRAPVVGYFDSYGYETPEMIARFMRSLTLQVKGCVLGYNARRFQYGGSECGMFSLYFLISMIHGVPFERFCKEALHDRAMLDLRRVLFSD